MLALLLALGLFVVGTPLLVLGADWFLDGAGDLARALGVSALVVGVLLAGLEPEEMLTAAIASARGAPALAVGNVIGTNVTIVTVALGLSALIFPMTISVRVRRQALIATVVSIIPIVLLFLGAVTRLEGVFLLVVFVGYTLFLFRTDREAIKRMTEAEAEDDDASDEEQQPHARPQLRWKPVLLTFAGLAAMAVGGPAIVEGALRLAQIIGLGQGAVGATIVSLGTGAEMIALGVSAARRKQSDILVGGILGSFAYNLLVTLGLAAAIHSIPVDPQVTFVALPVMVGVHLVLLALVWSGKISRVMGGLLVLVYAAYLVGVVVLRLPGG
ncbi:MAG TPA: sodium:calcium antiporter [Ktedonobacteraceae bacterium]|nr:sodium:calcium antiporter [Ktedonobacteraceae bacterium]